MKNKFFKYRILCILLSITVFGCKKFIGVESPATSINQTNVYANDNTATSVLTAIYAEMSNNGNGRGSISSLSLFPELGADNLKGDLTPLFGNAFYKNELSSTIDESLPQYWVQCYQVIYVTNAAIEGITQSSRLSTTVKTQLLGEAHFMRAFLYFYLVNLYGDVPLAISTDYVVNSKLPRSSKDIVYDLIISDLKAAQSLLKTEYVDVTLFNNSIDRIRPNKSAATALLARVYLYNGDSANAEIQATNIIENKAYYDLLNVDNVFIKNSKETIWALQPVIANYNTWEASTFKLPATGPNLDYPYYLSDHLIKSFENNDQRLNNWTSNVSVGATKYYYATKYKAITYAADISEYEIVLRLSEQYLIRAEARARLGKLTGLNSASSDLNTIRSRAGLLPTTAQTMPELLTAILRERQVELFTEWGHRWFDLKRTGNIDAVMSSVAPTKGPGITWQSYKALYPIPQSEIKTNSSLVGNQNPGY